MAMNIETLQKEDLKLLQLGLREEGYRVGPIDGVIGPRTRAAYLAYHGEFCRVEDLIVRIARGEIGVREEGDNGGSRIREYQGATWYEPGPWAWCAAFVCWVLQRAKAEIASDWEAPDTPGAWALQTEWAAKDPGVRVIQNPSAVLAGDILIYKFSHCGIAVQDSRAGSVIAVEGNTDGSGGREGDGVYERTRNLNQIRAALRV